MDDEVDVQVAHKKWDFEYVKRNVASRKGERRRMNGGGGGGEGGGADKGGDGSSKGKEEHWGVAGVEERKGERRVWWCRVKGKMREDGRFGKELDRGRKAKEMKT